MYNGVVLSGGGIKGLLHIGFLDEFFTSHSQDKIKYYSGCSIGALICVLLSIGYTPKELIKYFCTNDFCDIFKGYNPLILNNFYGMIDSNVPLNYIEKMILDKINYIPTFEQLYINFNKVFVCPSYKVNFKSNEEPYTYFSYRTTPKMSISKAACLSANIPIVFTKAEFEGFYYVDGGVFDNFPVNKLVEEIEYDPWSEHFYHILAVKFHNDMKQTEVNSFSDYVKHLFIGIMRNKEVKSNENVKIVTLKTTSSSLELDIDLNKKIDLYMEGKNQYSNFFKK
jgi:predicted acylesterase/phospholipase RssA